MDLPDLKKKLDEVSERYVAARDAREAAEAEVIAARKLLAEAEAKVDAHRKDEEAAQKEMARLFDRNNPLGG